MYHMAPTQKASGCTTPARTMRLHGRVVVNGLLLACCLAKLSMSAPHVQSRLGAARHCELWKYHQSTSRKHRRVQQNFISARCPIRCSLKRLSHELTQWHYILKARKRVTIRLLCTCQRLCLTTAMSTRCRVHIRLVAGISIVSRRCKRRIAVQISRYQQAGWLLRRRDSHKITADDVAKRGLGAKGQGATQHPCREHR